MKSYNDPVKHVENIADANNLKMFKKGSGFSYQNNRLMCDYIVYGRAEAGISLMLYIYHNDRYEITVDYNHGEENKVFIGPIGDISFQDSNKLSEISEFIAEKSFSDVN